MTEKKYAIVRVDNCPSKFEKGFNDYFVCDGRGKDMRLGADKINCKNCRYGDTKEQMVKKMAQVLFEAKLEIYKNVYGIIPNDKFMKDIYAKQLKVAKKIV